MLPDPSHKARHAAPSRGPRALRWAAALLAVLLLAGAVVRFEDDARTAVALVAADEPIITSDKAVVADLWRAYKEGYVEESTGRTVQHQSGGITTSQAQSWTMLRAVWMDDQDTFARSWQWTKDNLQRGDGLMARRFGERPDGTYGIQQRAGGGRSDTAADVDIAVALLMAYSRWKDDDHLYDALPVLRAVWERSVVRAGDRLVLAADDRQRSADRVLVEPSSLAPYAYRVFAVVDPDHDWARLVDDSYALLGDLADRPADARGPLGLAPDRVVLDRGTGRTVAVERDRTAPVGQEASRLSWRLALDSRWYGEERARALLAAQLPVLRGVAGNGRPLLEAGSPAVVGAVLGSLEVTDPGLADAVYREHLLPLYDADRRDVAGALGFYESNWVWFGTALHLDELPNLNVSQE